MSWALVQVGLIGKPGLFADLKPQRKKKATLTPDSGNLGKVCSLILEQMNGNLNISMNHRQNRGHASGRPKFHRDDGCGCDCGPPSLKTFQD